MNNLFIHLTNTSINKKSEDYCIDKKTQGDIESMEGDLPNRLLSEVMTQLEKDGSDFYAIKDKINRLI